MTVPDDPVEDIRMSLDPLLLQMLKMRSDGSLSNLVFSESAPMSNTSQGGNSFGHHRRIRVESGEGKNGAPKGP